MDIIRRIAENYSHVHSDAYSACWSKVHYQRFSSLIRNPEVWDNFQANGLAKGMGNSRNFHDGRRTVPFEFTDLTTLGITEERYQALVDMAGESFVKNLMETQIGSPPVAVLGGERIGLHDIRLIYNAWRISPYLDPNKASTVIEIGAGYGGLPYKLKRLFPHIRFILIDLPKANAIQTYYLSRAMPGAKLRLRTDKEDDDFDFAILPPDCLGQFPQFDLIINIRSFSEMRKQTIANYFSFIQNHARTEGIFYNVNRYANGASGDWVKFKDYPYDARWNAVYSAPAWIQPRIHELIARRTEQPGDIHSVCCGLSNGNVGLVKILMGLGEHPRDPIARTRRAVAKVVRRWRKSL